MSKPIRICVIGEWLHGSLDEGIHNLAQNLIDQWQIECPVSTIRIGADLYVNRLFLSVKLRKKLKQFRPDLVFYISPSCTKTVALFRAKMLKTYAAHAKVFTISTQPVAYNRLEKRILSFLVPDGIFVQSPRGKELLNGVPCPVYFLPSGVDLHRFVPVDPSQKKILRKKHGVDENALVILHVGHITRGRNVHLLSNISQLKDVQVIVVGSTSTPADETLVRQLTQPNVRIVREFIPHINEIYQLSDIYFFPVISDHDAIGVPLSVMEAMACNLTVITTRFGGLPQMFSEGDGFYFFDNEIELPKMIADAINLSRCSTRKMVEAYGWDSIAQRALQMTQSEESQGWS
jgi:glycosyltransferase involved in cell wall biosynthesis